MKIKHLKWLLSIGGLLAATVAGVSGWSPLAHAQWFSVPPPFSAPPRPLPLVHPQFALDPSWPKPLPSTITNGVAHQWVQGEVAGNCVDINNNVYTFSRGWEVGT